jgi:predicted transcriptional regulator
MTTSNQILNITVGESLREAGACTAATMKALAQGKKVQPHFGVNFEQIGQTLAALTPTRWELIAALRQAGPLTFAELARRLNRDYKNAHM